MNRRDFFKTTTVPIIVAAFGFKLIPGQTTFPASPYFELNDIIHIPRTGENVWVSSIKDGNMTVIRNIGQGNMAPTAINEDDSVWILGNAGREGDPEQGIRRDWTKNELYPSCFKAKDLGWKP